MELGVAGTIATKHFYSADMIDEKINAWLEDNPDTEIINIKITGSGASEDTFIEALIIYRKEY